MYETSKDRPNASSRRRPTRLAMAATIAGAMLIVGTVGYLKIGTAAPVAPAQTTGTTGPAGFADVVQSVKPAVISVRVRTEGAEPSVGSSDNDGDDNGDNGSQSPFRGFGSPSLPNGSRPHQIVLALGAGFFISPDGYAVTNNHVVDHAQSVEIATNDGKTYRAKIVGTDVKTDVALLKVDGRSDFPYVKFAEIEPRVGDWVIAVGNPYGLEGTVTAGIISARGRDIGSGPYDDFIQVDAPVNKGNSGGPAFDESGNVVGVTTAIYSPSGGSVGIGFAIPADTVKSVVAQLKEHGSVTRGWIGVQIQPVTQDIADSLGLEKAEGALVAESQAGSPAAKAGIASGDVIHSVNGEEVKDSRDLAKKIAAIKPDTPVKLGLSHDGSEKTVALTVAKMPSEKLAQNESTGGKSAGTTSLGLTLAPAGTVAGEGNRGVVVTKVDPDGAAAEHGIRSGDVILDISGKAVNSPFDVRQAVADARSVGKHTILMRIKSGDSTHFVAMPVAVG